MACARNALKPGKIYLICNNTVQSMVGITKDPLCLGAQVTSGRKIIECNTESEAIRLRDAMEIVEASVALHRKPSDSEHPGSL